MDTSDKKYDQTLVAKIIHYQKYSQMLPWVGNRYRNESFKLLMVGESHYMRNDLTDHHVPSDWYKGITLSATDNNWVYTRKVISRGIKENWKGKSKTIFRNADTAFKECAYYSSSANTFDSLAFMNYFQRPAERTGESIKVSTLDREKSYEVFKGVIEVLEPNAVLFTSKLAYENAMQSGLRELLDKKGISLLGAPHPATSWWYRQAKPYGNKTGKEFVKLFISENTKHLK